jgi:prephenate dehydrogenase
MQFKTLSVIGVGLIGAAIGLAAKRRKVAGRVVGADTDAVRLQKALERGAIDESFYESRLGVAKADVVAFCIPVNRIAEEAVAAAKSCSSGALFTDAGSTKSKIVSAVEGRLYNGISFVGAHPLAGSEKQGPEHANAQLFEGRTTIITRTAKTPTHALARAQDFWEALGTRVVVMTPEQHDQTVAFTSHLPHLAAVALAGILPSGAGAFAASGIRDVTRIASGDPALWTAIFSHNRDNVLTAIRQLVERLSQMQETLETSDWPRLLAFLDQGKKVRDALGN